MDTKSALEQARLAAKKSDKHLARNIIREIIKHEPQNEEALLLFADVAQKKKDAICCLEQLLELNPNNKDARLKLELLKPSVQEEVETEEGVDTRSLLARQDLRSSVVIRLVPGALWMQCFSLRRQDSKSSAAIMLVPAVLWMHCLSVSRLTKKHY